MSSKSYALLCGLPILPQETGQFSIYRDALDCIRMPGEIAYSLWIANQPAFKEAENHMKQGIERGKDNTSDLIKILTEKTWSIGGEVMNVYCQAWDFIDFLDSSDPATNLVSLAADKEFDTLQHIWNKKAETLVEGKIRALTQEMRQLSKQGKTPIRERHDSEEWKMRIPELHTKT